MEVEKLKRRCSWCGNFKPQLESTPEGANLFRVSCGSCGSCGPQGTKEYAIEQWNKGPDELKKAYGNKARVEMRLMEAESVRDGWKARCRKLFDDHGETIMVMTTCEGTATSLTKESRVCDQVGCSSGLPPDVCHNCMKELSDSFSKSLKRLREGG